MVTSEFFYLEPYGHLVSFDSVNLNLFRCFSRGWIMISLHNLRVEAAADLR